MSEQSISKAVFNKKGVTVIFTENKLIDGNVKQALHTIESPIPVHPDLQMCLKVLLPNFIKMSPLAVFFPKVDEKYIKGRNILDEKPEAPINTFEVNGVTFSGNADEEDYSVQLIGRLKYPNGKVISMTFPGERLNTEGGYALKDQLAEDINSLIDEFDKYVNEGKSATPSLFADAATGDGR